MYSFYGEPLVQAQPDPLLIEQDHPAFDKKADTGLEETIPDFSENPIYKNEIQEKENNSVDADQETYFLAVIASIGLILIYYYF